jgi:hypothetical protein
MTHVINIQHWLDEDGDPVPAVRRQALRVARLIEYGGPLGVGYIRGTLVECSSWMPKRQVLSVSMSSRRAAKLCAYASSVLAEMSNRPSAHFARRPTYVRL